MASKPHALVDLFAGCGGMSLGFASLHDPARLSIESNARNVPYFLSTWANDFNADAVATYAHNFGGDDHAAFGPIEKFLADNFKFKPASVVVGGPPCQGFSLLNKNRDGDERRELWQSYLDVVAKVGAEVFVMENVPQMLDGEEYIAIMKQAKKMGFKYIVSGIVCAANYGVPQTRRRALILASKHHPIAMPLPTHMREDALGRFEHDQLQRIGATQPWRTVRDAIGDLPKKPIGTDIGQDLSNPLALHFGRSPTAKSLARYRAVPPGGNRFDLQKNAPELTPDCWIRKVSGGTDLFGRMWWNRPAPTIRTEFYKPEKGRYLHPDQHRPITMREAARLQGFPDDFVFKGSKVEIAKQIGNAVPPQLAFAIAKEVNHCLRGERTKDDMDAHHAILGSLPLSKAVDIVS